MLDISDLVFEDGVQRYLNERKRIVGSCKEAFLFGSARGGQRVYDYLAKYGLQDKIKYVVDNDKMKQGKRFHGIEIISAEKLLDIYKDHVDTIIIIASGSAHIIKNQLVELGMPGNVIHPFVITNLQMSPTPYKFFVEKKDEISRVYEMLADEKSKECFISLLNFKMTQDIKWLKNIADNEHEQYFDPVMDMRENESFADCGTYIGDTLDAYNDKLNGKWKNIYCFEADPDIFRELEQHVESKGYKNVSLFNIGCWDEKTKLYFEKSGSGSSSITDKWNEVEIEADMIDSVLSDKEVSIIKMDIEGAEQKALKGAGKVISSQHPKLAISIYHSLEDFIKIPEMMYGYGNGYKIYIRHYRELSDSETVCYAV